MDYQKEQVIRCGFCKQVILQFKRDVSGEELIDVPNQLEWIDGKAISGQELSKCPRCAKSIDSLLDLDF
ncbi:hypothetical protein [Aquibacillus saliphilus]|uniref:hypothetical protein n=1 Tax=Aquibacillus saliphilus TaxID=1909422 RepID=UPI001CEFECB8|nr:hypothetical protein [Aquibacillus saliphilus]